MMDQIASCFNADIVHKRVVGCGMNSDAKHKT